MELDEMPLDQLRELALMYRAAYDRAARKLRTDGQKQTDWEKRKDWLSNRTPAEKEKEKEYQREYQREYRKKKKQKI